MSRPQGGKDANTNEVSTDRTVVDREDIEDAEKGSPPSHPPHVVKMEASLHGVRCSGRTLNQLEEIPGIDNLFRHRWCMMFCTFGLTNAYGVYQDYYVRVHLSNYPPSTIGWIGSFQVFLRTSGHLVPLYQPTHTDFILLSEFSGGLFAGIWFDKGYFYPMSFGFSLLFLFSFVGTLPVFDENIDLTFL
jgi:hypothetical protein